MSTASTNYRRDRLQSSASMGNPVTKLYDEVFNDQATWTDALFWTVIGGLIGSVIERLINWVAAWGGW